MRFNVTREDIAFGERGSCSRCPIALAIRRTFREENRLIRVAVTSDEVTLYDDSPGEFQGLGYFGLPLNCTRFIEDFDSDDPVNPFSFDITIAVKL